MFSFIADILTSITSILLPIFASYKALRTSDPAVLTPWLIYWTTLSLFLLAEHQLYFILSWIPFYAWLRLFCHLYLVLPGNQGSVYLYKEYIEPFLEEHERQIDRFISEAHEKAKAAGLGAVESGVEYVRVQVLGMRPKEPSPPPSRDVSYSTYLMSRFAMPSARQGLATAGTSDVSGLLTKALQQFTYPDSTSKDARAEDLAQSGSLIPPDLSGEDRTSYINTLRDHIGTLSQALNYAASTPPSDTRAATSSSQPRSSMPRQPSSRKSYLAPLDDDRGMHKSRSESEFEDLAYETMPDPEDYRTQYAGSTPNKPPPKSTSAAPASSGGSGWTGWIWGNYGERDSAAPPTKRD